MYRTINEMFAPNDFNSNVFHVVNSKLLKKIKSMPDKPGGDGYRYIYADATLFKIAKMIKKITGEDTSIRIYKSSNGYFTGDLVFSKSVNSNKSDIRHMMNISSGLGWEASNYAQIDIKFKGPLSGMQFNGKLTANNRRFSIHFKDVETLLSKFFSDNFTKANKKFSIEDLVSDSNVRDEVKNKVNKDLTSVDKLFKALIKAGNSIPDITISRPYYNEEDKEIVLKVREPRWMRHANEYPEMDGRYDKEIHIYNTALDKIETALQKIADVHGIGFSIEA